MTPRVHILAGSHEASVLRELPLRPTSRFRRTRGGYGTIPRSEILLYIYTFNNPGTKTMISRSISHRTVWKPHPHPLVAERLELKDPVHCVSCPLGDRRGFAVRRVHEVLSPGQKALPYIYESDHPGTKILSPGSIPPGTV